MKLRRIIPAAIVLPVLAASGCKAPPRVIAEGFHGPLQGWSSEEPEGADGSGRAVVLNGRLLLEGRQVLLADLPFLDLRLASEMTVAGGMLEGSAGIFLQERTNHGKDDKIEHFVLAVNGRGEWMAYRGYPDLPLGVPKWAPLADPNPAAPRLLAASRGEGGIRFSVDGREVASFPAQRRNPADQGPRATTEVRAGVFSALLSVAVDSFVAGEDAPESPFDPATALAVDPSAAARHAEGLQAEAKARTAAFKKKPTRAGLLGVLEAYTSAERARDRSGAAGGTGAEEIEAALLALEKPARQARSDDLIRLQARSRALSAGAREKLISDQGRAFAARAREAAAAGRPTEALIFWLAAAEVDRTPEAEAEAKKGLGTLEPLRFKYAVREEGPPSKELSRQHLFAAVRAVYGSLPPSPQGEVGVEVVIQEAAVEHETADAARKVPLSVSEKPMGPALRAELERLEKSFPEDILDAAERAKVVRMLDRQGGGRIAEFEYQGKVREVTKDDAKSLEAAAARLAELRAKRESEKGKVTEFVDVPAKLHTDTARLRIAYSLTFGEVSVADEAQAYAGFEQWSHPADKARKIPASVYDPAEKSRVVESVRDRVVGRLRTGIARERIIEALPPDEATRFILRFARSTGEARDRTLAAWRLKSSCGLEGVLADRVLEALLR